jgi:iron-sulfur cluster repair protein YtfE (RIC family)
MKRHESLAPLSREHHEGLILAQLLKKGAPAYRGLPTDLAGKLSYAREMFERILEGHFMLEEKMLDMLSGQHGDIDTMAAQIREEHQRLVSRFHELSFLDASLENRLDELGHELEAHIRTEERILFPAMQERCSSNELESIGLLIENASHEKRYPKQD